MAASASADGRNDQPMNRKMANEDAEKDAIVTVRESLVELVYSRHAWRGVSSGSEGKLAR